MDQAIPPDPPPDYETVAAGPQRSQGMRFRRSAPIRKGLPGPLPLELPILTYLKSKRVILASASPRRKALLAQIGLSNLEILPSTEPEDLSKEDLGPEAYVAATARRKCLSVYQAALDAQEKQQQLRDKRAKGQSKGMTVAEGEGVEVANDDGGGDEEVPDDPAVVIAADTVIVTRAGRVLEKPRNEAEHGRMLRHLRDTESHRVLTAVCVLAPKPDASYPGYETAAHTEETRVFFAQAGRGLPDDVIDSYVRTREGADKAGGYAMQGIGGLLLVERVEGSVDNVVGLPVRKCLQLCERAVFRQGEEDEPVDEDD